MKKKKEKMCESLYVFPPHKKRGNDRETKEKEAMMSRQVAPS